MKSAVTLNIVQLHGENQRKMSKILLEILGVYIGISVWLMRELKKQTLPPVTAPFLWFTLQYGLRVQELDLFHVKFKVEGILQDCRECDPDAHSVHRIRLDISFSWNASRILLSSSHSLFCTTCYCWPSFTSLTPPVIKSVNCSISILIFSFHHCKFIQPMKAEC